jgi:hypothetical protein
MKTKLVFFLGLFILYSCDNEDTLADNEFLVVIENTADIACSLPVIHFLQKEEQVKKKTSIETLTYNAYHLDNSLNVVGTKLIIEFTRISTQDIHVCNTLGTGYPGISIVRARPAN